jgi:hypothetical protein
MPRALSIARVRVATGDEAEYLAVVAELAALADARGQHLWVFRHGADPHTFVEFSESRGAADHRSVRSLSPRELALEARRAALVEKLPGGDDLWIEVALRKVAPQARPA